MISIYRVSSNQKMHSFTSGSSIVTLTRHPSGGSGNTNPPGTTLAFTDADGNVITLPDGVVTSTGSDGGVTIVTTDSLVGSHFLSATDGVGPVTKIEIDEDNINQMDLMASSPGASTSKGIKKGMRILFLYILTTNNNKAVFIMDYY